MGKFSCYIFVLVVFLVACSPEERTNTLTVTVESGTVVLTPQIVSTSTMVPVPAPQAVTPEPFGTPALREVIQTCSGEVKVWGEYHVQMCGGKTFDFQVPAGSELVLVAATTLAFKAQEVTTVAIITSATETIGFVAFVHTAAPVLVVGGLLALPVISVIDLIVNPPQADPAIEQWLANRYPTLVAQGVVDETGMIDIPAEFVTNTWSEELRKFKINGFTAVILEDDVLLATVAYHTVRSLGFTVLGVFPSCEIWMASGIIANVYVLDNVMLGAMRAPECASKIHEIAPLSMVIVHSGAAPDDLYRDNKSLYDYVSDAMGKANTGGAEKTSDGINLARELIRIFGGG